MESGVWTMDMVLPCELVHQMRGTDVFQVNEL
jgi:hypothetical protein